MFLLALSRLEKFERIVTIVAALLTVAKTVRELAPASAETVNATPRGCKDTEPPKRKRRKSK